jgi:hypothetical protein
VRIAMMHKILYVILYLSLLNLKIIVRIGLMHKNLSRLPVPTVKILVITNIFFKTLCVFIPVIETRRINDKKNNSASKHCKYSVGSKESLSPTKVQTLTYLFPGRKVHLCCFLLLSFFPFFPRHFFTRFSSCVSKSGLVWQRVEGVLASLPSGTELQP